MTTDKSMSIKIKKKHPGRPSDPTKRKTIIKAATGLFLERPFAEISMDDVARKARVSKVTLYKHFADKNELFQIILEKKLDDHFNESHSIDLKGKDVFDGIFDIAKEFAFKVYSKDGMNIFRTVVSESKRGSTIPQIFYKEVLEPWSEVLCGYLLDIERSGHYFFPDKKMAANMLLTMLRGDLFTRIALKIDTPDTESSVCDEYIREIVKSYLKMYRKPEGAVLQKKKTEACIS